MNVVLHKYIPNVTDKVYMVGIRIEGGKYIVIAKWGKRGRAVLQTQVKGEFSSRAHAVFKLGECVNKQKREGYFDIASPAYKSRTAVPIVEMSDPGIKSNLESNGSDDTEAQKIAASVPPPNPFLPPKEKIAKVEELTVICVNNLGIEDKFDLNIEYVAVARVSDFSGSKQENFIEVYDKNGSKAQYLVSRFKLVSEPPSPSVQPPSSKKGKGKKDENIDPTEWVKTIMDGIESINPYEIRLTQILDEWGLTKGGRQQQGRRD